MIRRAAPAVFVLAAASLIGGADPTKDSGSQPSTSKPDRSYGTTMQWESDLHKAAKLADRQDKLLLVLAVAGHFEDPFFT